MATVVNQQQMSDAELIGAARAGDSDAYAELYRRHVDSARAAARALCRNRSDADDVVSEAFAKVLRILQHGNGPEIAFRPYLLTAVRNCFYDKTRRKREDPLDEPTGELNLTLIDTAASDDDKALATAAFATLPERWQLVLWHTEVEGRSPAEVAPLLGLAPNAVAALAYRAREGLRQAFLQAHLRTPRETDCQNCAGSLGAYVRDGLSARDRRKVDDHLSGCDQCKALLVELTDTNTTLRAALIPAIVGVPAAAYLSGLGGKGLLAWFGRLPRHQQAGAGAAAAAVAAVVVAAAVSAGGGNPTVAAPTTTRPRPVVTTVVAATTVADTVPVTVPRTIPPVVTPAVTSTLLPTTLPPATTVAPTRRVTPVPRVTVPASVPDTTVPEITVAAPTSTIATTTTLPAAVTTLPIVPRLTLTSTQIGSGFVGGQARVRLGVTAAALPTNAFRTNAFSNLVITIPLPTGVTVAAVDNAAWSCTPQGACTIAALATGESTTAVLTFDIASTATSPIAIAPTVTTPANAVVQSTPLSLAAATVPGLLAQEFAKGDVVAVGNSVLDCTKPPCTPIDPSTADLVISGTVAKAVLVWSGVSPAADTTVTLTTPAGSTEVVAATAHVSTDYSEANPQAYVAYHDVTALVTGAGTYGISNMQTSPNSFGGWLLIVVTHDVALPERSLIVAVPVGYVKTGTDYHVVVPGTAGAPAVHLVASVFEGNLGLDGDDVAVNGTGGIGGADPFWEELGQGVDLLDEIVTPLGSGDFELTFSTSDDRFTVEAIGIALDVV